MSQNTQTFQRDTVRTLFKNVLEMVKDNGHYSDAERIMDYAQVSTADERRELTDYEFDSVAYVEWGASEGIYVTWYLQGSFDSTKDGKLKVGTFKTLETTIEAFKTMGALAGALTFYGYRYVNANLERYEPFFGKRKPVTGLTREQRERVEELIRTNQI